MALTAMYNTNPLNPSFSKMLGPDMCSLLGANGSVLAMLFDAQGVAIDATETDIPVVCNALCSKRTYQRTDLVDPDA
ncbi:hypothetical protein CC1G_10345 [Coprinopsis cinerea okayama7|uniref:Uncharacterized protein n=1 Tax=Coprinopsis cinerea (strain Okayama-7 / 130 / ATCC MYA-4618 / FGSC 9003) TaxID=240176 RepID=A8PE61_COPC7|nr:hypothetical protein CC1G_10345 [Coprinopsis cinerea okayama7\|eukprot:XP_001840731.2 hypothetical protein CC1G_10345 [Coprinopsis cinerea okayama7\